MQYSRQEAADEACSRSVELSYRSVGKLQLFEDIRPEKQTFII
jgi:hypothetical protein